MTPFLFHQDKVSDLASYEAQVAVMQAKADAFRARAADNLAPENEARVQQESEAWLRTPEADTLLRAWLQDIVTFIDTEMPGNGPVGHDKRHLAKDLAAGLRHIEEDDVSAFETLSVIPSFLHDTGRLVEPMFHGKVPFEKLSADHPLFSFLIADQFSEKEYFKKIPQAVTDQILSAILEHSNPRMASTLGKAVQSSDREQLIGPEGIARLLAVQPGTFDRPIVISDVSQRSLEPRDSLDEAHDALHAIEFYARNLYPQVGTHGEEHADELKAISGAFLFLAATDEVRNQIFPNELYAAKDLPRFKKPLSDKVWASVCSQACRRVERPVGDVKKVIAFVFEAPGASAVPESVARFTKHFKNLSAEEQANLTNAVTMVADVRAKRDANDLALLDRVAARPSFMSVAAQWARQCLTPKAAK